MQIANSAPIHRVINFLKQVKIVEPYSGLTIHAKKWLASKQAQAFHMLLQHMSSYQHVERFFFSHRTEDKDPKT